MNKYHVSATFTDGIGMDGATIEIVGVSPSQLAVASWYLIRWEPPFPDGEPLVSFDWADDHTLDPSGWMVRGVSGPQLAALSFELMRAAGMLRDAIENAQKEYNAFDREKLVRVAALPADHLRKGAINGGRH